MQLKNAVGEKLSYINVRTTRIAAARQLSVKLLMIFGLLAAQAAPAIETAGSTAGNFTVTPSGGASYSIPIAVPPGTAGMVPSLALVYNSQAGDGLMGMGWKLSGLSAITRCPKTLVQDGVREGVTYTSTDKYCLDSQRLVPATPATISNPCASPSVEYRTERENFARVVSCGTTTDGTGPQYFKVWTKAGQIIEFGNTADSKIEAQGKTAIRLWAVNKVIDTKGNYLTVSYNKDTEIVQGTPQYTGQYYPNRIDYTGHSSLNRTLAPYNSVRFEYESREYANPVYDGGSLMKGTKRLTHIKTYARSSTTVPVKDYRLAYEYSYMTKRSRLISLAECDGAGTSAVCLRPTTFSWPYIGRENSACGVGYVPGFCYSDTWAGHGVSTSLGRWVDLNGDGRADYLTSNLAGTSYVSLSTGSGYADGLTWVEPAASPRGAAWVDVNGDGKADMVTADANGVQSIAYSTGASYETPVTLNPGTAAGAAKWTEGYYPRGIQYTCTSGGVTLGRVIRDDYPARCEGDMPIGSGGTTGLYSPIAGGCFCPDSHYWVDLNGDGKADYVAPDGATHHVSLSTDTPNVYINQTWTAQAKSISGHHWVDLNGDGKADYVTNDTNGNHYVSLSTGTGYINQTWAGHGISTSGAHWADLNGDGKSDYVTNDTNGTHYVSMSTGTGYVNQTWSGHGISTHGTSWVDVNGDGKADYVTSDANGNHYISLSTGAAYLPPQTWSSGTAVSDTGWNWADLNGDGIADVVTNDTAGHHYVAFSGSRLSMRDGMSKITNGLGATTEIGYSTLSATDAYQKETTGIYPVIDIQVPMHVVIAVSNSNGIGGSYSSSYSYAGAKAHVKGGGFLGFRVVNSTDTQTGIKSTTTHRQDYPYQGLISKVEKFTASGGVLNRAENTWNFDTNTQWSAQYHVPKLTQSVESSWELAASGTGGLISTLTTTTEYDPLDPFGNPKIVTTSTGDGYTKKSTHTYYPNDTQKWFLGRLKSTAVESTAPDTVPSIPASPSIASISIAALSADKAEGNSGTTPFTFTVVRTGNSGGISSVQWAVSGTGTHPANPDDFVGGVFPSGTVSFSDGQTSKTLQLDVQANKFKGSDDEFKVTLSNQTNAALGTSVAFGNIRNDDTILPPVISITALAADKAEGDSGTTAYTFTVSRSGQDVTGLSTVKWTVSGSGTAPVSGADFVGGTLPTGTLTFAGGQTSLTLTVNVQTDLVFESDEGFTVTLSQATDATLGTLNATGIIRNDAGDAFFLNKVFSANQSGYNLRTAAIEEGWNQVPPLKATVTVNSGVVISASSTATPAFTINGSYPAGSTIDLVIQSGAYIVGKGGAGAIPNGLAGGPALSVASSAATVRITNNGVIGGGGGAGGYGGSGWVFSCDNGSTRTGAGYGGGGAGYGPGPGAVGGLTTGGAGASLNGAVSGSGGGLGAAGGNGHAASCVDSSVHYGGVGGAAVLGDENIKWLAAGTRLGTMASSRVVSSIQPNTGYTWGGATITVNGSGFVPGMTVTLGGVAATGCTVNAARTAITCTTPANSAGAKDVVVSSGGTPITLSGAYTYQALALNAISPTGGIETGGTAVTLSGSGFVAGTTVIIGGVTATGCTITSSTSMTCITPAGSIGAKDVVVSLAGHSTTLIAGYTYTIAPFNFNSVLTSMQNYNLRTAAIAAGWDQVKPLIATVTINNGVVISASSTATPAFTINGSYLAGSIINVDIKAGAYIVGKGGAGANPNGLAGGPALSIASSAATVRITNNGVIGGGGGGGGYGGKGWRFSCDNGSPYGGTTYGGGGAGYGPGPGAVGGLAAGGAGATSYGSVSGSGGGLGVVGGNGHAASCVDNSINYGGAAGSATIGAANATWLVTGTRLGAVQ